MKKIFNYIVFSKKTFFILGIFSALAFLYQCKNDLDVFDDWKDHTIVYGLINPTDSLQIIRISKSFLGDGDAYQMAQINDSIYYNKPMTVQLLQMSNGNIVRTITLHKDSSIARDSGVFAYQKNYYFVTSETINEETSYKLLINIDGKEINSETKTIGYFTLQDVPNTVSFTPSSFKFKIKTPANARVFQPVFRFYYYEITATDTIKKQLDIKLSVYSSTSIDGGELINIEYPGNSFFEAIANKISIDNNVIKRIAAKNSLQIIIYAGSNELFAYLQVSGPSTGLTMDKPSYTNINNGLGLFTSRYSKYDLIKFLSSRTIDSLAHGQKTYKLKFLDYSSSMPFWSQFP